MLTLDRDRETYAGYLAEMESRFADHTAGNGRVWLQSAPWGSFGAAFRGTWGSVRRYVTPEFRQWVEEYGVDRLTFSQWQETARREREREALSAEITWVEIEPGVWLETW